MTAPYWSPRIGSRTLPASSRLSGSQSMSKDNAYGDPGPFSRTSVHHAFRLPATPMWLATTSSRSPIPRSARLSPLRMQPPQREETVLAPPLTEADAEPDRGLDERCRPRNRIGHDRALEHVDGGGQRAAHRLLRGGQVETELEGPRLAH